MGKIMHTLVHDKIFEFIITLYVTGKKASNNSIL